MEGDLNLAFSKNHRAGLSQGAQGINFNLDDSQQGGEDGRF
jgi:hypothetical protein